MGDDGRRLGENGLHEHPKDQPCGEHCQVGRWLAGAVDRLAEGVSVPDTREKIEARIAELSPADPWWELCRKVGATGQTDSDVAHDLRRRLILRWTGPALADALIDMARRMHRTGQRFYEIEQTLGKALGCPEYTQDLDDPDSPPTGEVCVGEHTPETLAAEAAQRIRVLTAELRGACDWIEDGAEPMVAVAAMRKVLRENPVS